MGGLLQRISFFVRRDGRRLFGYRDAVLIFCGFMGLDAENDEICIGIDRDDVLGFGGWLFLPRGLVSWLFEVGIVITYVRLLV